MPTKILSNQFCVWAIGGFLVPMATFALAKFCECPVPGPNIVAPWQSIVIESMLVFQSIYLVGGVIVLRENRWAALIAGVSLMMLTMPITLAGVWAVTGTIP